MGNHSTGARAVRAIVACGLLASSAACGNDDGTSVVERPDGHDDRRVEGTTPDTTRPDGSMPPTTVLAGWPENPPPIVVEDRNGPIELDPFTTCWQAPPNAAGEAEGYCADGMVPDLPPAVEPVDDEIRFSFAVDDWSFEARFFSPSEAVPDAVLDVEPSGASSWVLSVPHERPSDIIVVSGYGPQGDVHVAISLPPTVHELDCADGFDEIVALLRNGLPTYDYDRTESTAELAARADTVVTGRLSSIGRVDIEDEDVGAVSYTTITIEDVTTLAGNATAPDPIDVVTGAMSADFDDVEIAGGAGVLAFVHLEPGTPAIFVVDVQGLAVDCNDGPVVDVIEPLPADLSGLPLGELAQLIRGDDPPG